MKRFANLAVIATLAFGAQAVSCAGRGQRLGPQRGAGCSRPTERYEAAREARPLSSGRNMRRARLLERTASRPRWSARRLEEQHRRGLLGVPI